MHEGVFSLVAGLDLMLACVVERGASRPPRGALGNAKVAAAVEPAGATGVADLMLADDDNHHQAWSVYDSTLEVCACLVFASSDSVTPSWHCRTKLALASYKTLLLDTHAAHAMHVCSVT
jgi:hypothetical protein